MTHDAHLRTPAGRPRARALGIPFDGTPGEHNAITDVPGVELGYATLIAGEGPLVVGQGPVRTGVTAIHPRGRADPGTPCAAGFFSLNGNGEMTGTVWIEEAGALSLPVTVTNTHAVGIAQEATIAWTTDRHPELTSVWALPVAAETWDGYLNDINGRHVTSDVVMAALDGARGGAIEEGSVGGGTGMNCYSFKGGSGSASRRVVHGSDGYTVGVFVQANFGARHELVVAGVPVGRELLDDDPMADPAWLAPPGAGSVIAIVATDAPLLPGQCKALARRVPLGLARTGTTGSHFSGDIFLAFSTANHGELAMGLGEAASGGYGSLRFVPWTRMDPFFAAVVHATEEAVLNALCAAEEMVGVNGRRSPGLPHARVAELLGGARSPRVNGELSAEEACRAALERLESENPRIGAVVAWDGERALAEARERDGLPHVWRGPLHGVPFTAKDLNDATPYATTYGSRAFAENIPAGDAACIARLRRAGAVLIGKTNTPEMGLRPTTENLLFGPTRNPYDTARTPGGSSGGAAAALAAGIGTLAHGSDGGGSIRIPAACCGVVGHKPTRGLVSGAPASYDAWEGFATNGPMARSVADCALMLEVMAGPEPGDTYSAPPHDGAFAAACVEDPAPLTLGVIRDPPAGVLDDEVAAIFDTALALLAHMGHRVEEAEAPLAAVMEPFHAIVLGQTAAFRQMLPPERYELLEPTTRAAVTDGERIGAGEYVMAVAAARRATAAVLEALAPFELVVCPVLTRPAVPLDEFPLAAPRLELWREYYDWHSYTIPFNVTGQPALSLPIGTTAGGLPVGMQIVGALGADALVLSLGAAFERALV